MHLDVESLRTFIQVVDQGGMTRAAENLDQSQSAVSWKIKRLEEKVGRDLLIRDGRSIRPSRDGRELLDYARSIVSTHDEAVWRLENSDLTGTINLGTTEESCAACMAAVFSRFNRIHTRATITFHVDGASTLDAMLERGELDVAVLPVGPDGARGEDTVLWTDDLVWVAAPDWTYEEGEVPLITFGENGFYLPLASQALGDAGIPHRVAFSGPSSASVLSAVEAGVGVALISSRSVTGDVVVWPRAGQLAALPAIRNVARCSPGDRSTIAKELIKELDSELGEF